VSKRNKSLFGSFSSEKEQNLLFLKKKKQKDFYFLAALQGPMRTPPWVKRRLDQPSAGNKSLFGSFSSEKEQSFSPSCASV
jgi:hypothetical protein